MEGVSYSLCSIPAITDLVGQHRTSFGFVPAAIFAYTAELEKMAIVHLSREGDAGACVLLDGSAVYGSLRPDGWLDLMRRYVCLPDPDTQPIRRARPESAMYMRAAPEVRPHRLIDHLPWGLRA